MNDEIDATPERIEGEEPAPACSVSPALQRLSKTITELQRLLASGELEADLRRFTLANPVRHGDRVLSSQEAHVMEMLARHARPLPLRRLAPRQVAAIPHLERTGFVDVRSGIVALTPRGRAFGVTRIRRSNVTKVEANEWRKWANDLSRFE